MRQGVTLRKATRSRTSARAARLRRLTYEPLELRALLSVVPLGNEFRANTHTTAAQQAPAIAADSSGNYVIAWQSSGQDGSGTGIYAQRFNAAGIAQGAEFRANTLTAGHQSSPAIAMDDDGDFVVVWQSDGQDGSGYGIYAQRYSAAGIAQGAEFRVNTLTASHQSSPAVAMDDDGDFVVAWQSDDGSGNGIFAQRYNAAGAAQGSEFLINTNTTDIQANPALAMDADGDFVVVWQSLDQDGSGYGIYAQRFDAAGVAQGAEFSVSIFTTDNQLTPAAAMDADGDFVIVWSGRGFGDGSVGQGGIFARRYNAAGVALNSLTLVNSFTANQQTNPSVSMTASGDYVVVWDGAGPDDSSGIFAQRFNAAGEFAPEGQIRVNSYTSNAQVVPVVAAHTDLDFVVAWQSTGQEGPADEGIYVQRFGPTVFFPVGSEFRVNTTTTNSHDFSRSATDANGNFVVVWQASGQDGSGYGIYAQRYDSSGVAQGAEFRVNTHTPVDQTEPAVAMDASGDFVVVWQSNGQDGSSYGVYAQRYDALGVAQGPEFRVNSYTVGGQFRSAVAMGADGDFVVVWESAQDSDGSVGIYAQRYNSAGVAQGPEFRANTYTTGSQKDPKVAMDADGDFAIVWRSNAQDGSSYGIYAQRFDSAGVAQGAEFRVNTYTSGLQATASLAMDADGDFVVVWVSGQTGDEQDGVYAQRYNAAGVAQGPEFRVNTDTENDQNNPAVAMDSRGNFVVAWQSGEDNFGGFGVFARIYDASGAPLEPEFHVNTFTEGPQIRASVALSDGGEFVITWSGAQDTPFSQIHAQRYRVSRPGDFNDDGTVDALDIDILWRIVRGTGSDPVHYDRIDLDESGTLDSGDVDFMLASLLTAGPNRQYGDADLDGDVDGADFDAWRIRDSLGGGIGWATGDWDGDGDVDGVDQDLWRLRPTTYPAEFQFLTAELAAGPTSVNLAANQVDSVPGPASTVPDFQPVASNPRASLRASQSEAHPPQPDIVTMAAIDEVLAEPASLLYRSRHLRRGAPQNAELPEQLAGKF